MNPHVFKSNGLLNYAGYTLYKETFENEATEATQLNDIAVTV